MSDENFKEISYASVRKNNKNEFYISGCNRKFKELAEKVKISPEKLVVSNVFKEALKSMIPHTESVMLKAGGTLSGYFITAIPIAEKGIFCKMIIFISEIQGIENKTAFEKLTAREKEVFMLAADGLTNKNIASQLEIKEGTVKKILNNCYKKLDISSRIDAVKLFYSSL